jgi:hypothetical protein
MRSPCELNQNARLMAYSIDYLKMQLLSEEFEIFNEERKSERRVANFIAIC